MLKTLLIGHLGRDAETNTVNGKTVINFPVAHSERYNDQQGNQQKRTTWAQCAFWSDKTTILPYLKKGTQVYIEGRPYARTYKRNDGTTDSLLQMSISIIRLLGSSSAARQNGHEHHENEEQQLDRVPPPSPSSEAEYPPVSEGIAEPLDELPF